MRILSFSCFILISAVCYSQNLKSGGKLKPEQANMDIRHYTIALDVDPVLQSVDGYTEISLIVLKKTNVLLFDFWNGLTISRVWINGKVQSFEHDSSNMITLKTAEAIPAGKLMVKIAYSGKPGIAARPPWTGGFQWSKDSKGNPWIAVTCQGEGATIFFPCKDHPSDEPNEGADMIITVPKGLTATAPGLLQKATTKKNKTTWHWKTNYTISNYCLVFNIGKYKMARRIYTTIDGNKVPMEYYVLDENVGKAEKLLDLFEQSSHIHEKYFGEYPWVKERIAASETPHLGMEHQTNIAYGNRYRYEKVGGKDFDWLLHHEYGHEWWANKVTNKDWAHMWIQEGICVFGDAMAIRELAGEAAYRKKMQQIARSTENRLPIVQGEEIDSDQTYQPDIYGKGAFFMHTLRYIMGDSIFFPALKKLATDPAYTYDNNVTTADVEKLFSAAYGKSLLPLFNLYLYSVNKIEVSIKQVTETKYEIRLLNLDMEIPMDIVTHEGQERITLGKKPVLVNSNTALQADPTIFFLRKVIME